MRLQKKKDNRVGWVVYSSPPFLPSQAGPAHPPHPNPWQVCMRKQGALRKDLAERPDPDGAAGAEPWHDYFAALERSLGHEFVKRGCFSSWHGGRSLSCCIIDLAHISHAALSATVAVVEALTSAAAVGCREIRSMPRPSFLTPFHSTSTPEKGFGAPLPLSHFIPIPHEGDDAAP